MNSETIRHLCESNDPVEVIADAVQDTPDLEIYAVIGWTSGYDNSSDWVVRCFSGKETATAYSGRLNKWCSDHRIGNRETRDRLAIKEIQRAQKTANPLDPEMEVMEFGVFYSVKKVRLI